MLYFIVNRQGGSGKAAKTWSRVKGLLKEKGIDYKAWETKGEGHATTIAANISKLPGTDKRLIVVGGDGTINEVVNGIVKFEGLKLGVIPTGSGNDFARGMGIPSDTRKALELILSSEGEKVIDLGEITYADGVKKRFAISMGIGMDAIVCKEALTSSVKPFLNKLHLGKLTYLVLTVKTLFSMKQECVTVTFDDSEERTYDKLVFMAGMNFFAEGGGVPMAPGALCDDGLLSVCIASGIPRWRAFLSLPILVLAKHERIKGFEIKECEYMDIETKGPMVLHTDGEVGRDIERLHVECLKSAIKMLV